MVKCKFNHVFKNMSVRYNANSQQLRKVNPDFGQITNCFLVNQGTQMVLTTAAQKVYWIKIPELST